MWIIFWKRSCVCAGIYAHVLLTYRDTWRGGTILGQQTPLGQGVGFGTVRDAGQFQFINTFLYII